MRSHHVPRLFALAVVCAAGCSGSDNARPAFQPGRVSYDVSPIDITVFVSERAVQRRILYMPFGEVAARLGALRFAAETSFAFSRSNESYDQLDTYAVEHGMNGDFHVRMKTPVSSVEFSQLGEDVYVRLDHGQLRRKPRREVETETWADVAFSSLHHALDLFRPRLTFVDPQPDDVGGRSTTRYRVALGEAPDPTVVDVDAVPAGATVAPPARWRELASPLALTGSLWIDAATGVVTKARFEGRLEIADREVRPTQLKMRYRADIEDIGTVRAIAAPKKSVAEFRRVAPARDPLSFFAQHLAAPEPPAAP